MLSHIYKGHFNSRRRTEHSWRVNASLISSNCIASVWTHWHRVAHASTTRVSSGIGLGPMWHQAITWTKAAIGRPGTIFGKFLRSNTIILSQLSALEYIVGKIFLLRICTCSYLWARVSVFLSMCDELFAYRVSKITFLSNLFWEKN